MKNKPFSKKTLFATLAVVCPIVLVAGIIFLPGFAFGASLSGISWAIYLYLCVLASAAFGLLTTIVYFLKQL